MERYEEIFKHSINDPNDFWGDAAQAISWYKKWDKVLDDTNKPFYRWFTGGELNTCYNALDRHVENRRADQTALIYDSPVTNQIQKFTYREFRDLVALFAGALKEQGIRKGDTVIIYMPMIPQAVIAMLACARLGAIHSVVFGGFAPRELAIRIDDAKPKIIISASCGIEFKKVIEYKPMLKKAIELASHKPEKCIIFQRPQVKAELIPGFDYGWDELMAKARPADCVPVKSTDPLYILYTSGTTGKPKGIVRDNGGHAVALCWSMKYIYDTEPGDVYWAASDVGWVVGHSYIVYAPLIHGCTTILYEGKPVGTPDAGAFWRVISEHKVKVMFTAPTAFRAIKREDPNGEYIKKYDLSGFKYLFLAGERLDPDTYHWAHNLLQKPVIDHWWQTETGWPITANCIGIEPFSFKPGSSTKPVPGYDVQVLDSNGNVLGPKQEGLLAVKLPLPPGTLSTLYQADERFLQSYVNVLPGYYFTADGGYMDEDGYIFVMGRVDDVINVAGHRLSTGEMEEIIATHADVAECAVIGVADSLKGQLPVGLFVLKAGVKRNPTEIRGELVKMIREQIGPFACFKDACVVARLPKTRSGKILRRTMRKIADGEPYSIPSTIDDPTILSEIEESFRGIGYAKSTFKLGDFELTWLNGGKFAVDGGAMFGVVPKTLWTKKYPADEDNCVPLMANPILIKTPHAMIVIESGVGNKLDEKQKKIFKLQEEWQVVENLALLGISREDIDFVVLTHYDWDHAGGVVMKNPDGELALTFPKAKHIVQKREWEDVLNPNRRSANSYWPVNYETLKNSDNLILIEGDHEIAGGVKIIHTGGHNRGHQIVRLESQGEIALHLADLLPTHAHFNPLWVMAYDLFPLDVIALRERWEQAGLDQNAWFIFYHDPFMRACRFDYKGNVVEKWE